MKFNFEETKIYVRPGATDLPSIEPNTETVITGYFRKKSKTTLPILPFFLP